MKRSTSIFAACVLAIATVSMAFAAEGNARKGKYLYRQKCRSCHGVNASDLSPSSKTQAEWKKLFAKPEAIKCFKEWKGVTPEEKTDIFAYLHDFAKDSPSPAKCN